MVNNHKKLQETKKKCKMAKEELSVNLHTRLRYCAFVWFLRYSDCFLQRLDDPVCVISAVIFMVAAFMPEFFKYHIGT